MMKYSITKHRQNFINSVSCIDVFIHLYDYLIEMFILFNNSAIRKMPFARSWLIMQLALFTSWGVCALLDNYRKYTIPVPSFVLRVDYYFFAL